MRSWLMVAGAVALAGVSFAQDKLTLDQAVSEALQKNAALLAERANIGVAEARIITARLRPNPTLTFSPNHLPLLGRISTTPTEAGRGKPPCTPITRWSAAASARRG